MKTKIIPFDLEMAKKIQAGEIKGKIVRRGEHRQVCEILEFCAEWQTHCNEKFLIVKVPAHDFEREQLWIYHQDGKAHHGVCTEMWYDLVLEVSDEPQFKPFDKVLVRDNPTQEWVCTLLSSVKDDGDYPIYLSICNYPWLECIPYEGNEYLVGTTNKPKEE